MATAILSSRTSLTHHQFDHQNPNSRFSRHNSHAATTAPPRRRKQRSPTKPTTMVESPKTANTNLVMGKVKILKRGETLTSIQNKENNRDTRGSDDLRKMNEFDLVVDSINRLGPEPEMVQKQIGGFKGLRSGYAGSNCSISPPPSSVPIPKFLV